MDGPSSTRVDTTDTNEAATQASRTAADPTLWSPTWHQHKKDDVIRHEMISMIVHVIQRRELKKKRKQPERWNMKIPKIARTFEHGLYRLAATKEVYQNIATLELRMHEVTLFYRDRRAFCANRSRLTKSGDSTTQNASPYQVPCEPQQKRQRRQEPTPTVAPFTAKFPRRTLLSSSRWVNKVPHDIWVYKIFQLFLDLKVLSTLGRCNTFFLEYWQYILKHNVIQVPEQCSTMDEAMEVAVIFSERNECTRENPVKVEVGEGEHVMVGCGCGGGGAGNYYGKWRHLEFSRPEQTHVSCSNITIVGKGKGKTTMLGGFYVTGKQNVKIEQLAVTNDRGSGLRCQGSGTNVDVTECCFKKCFHNGMSVYEDATVTATRCDFMENNHSGVLCEKEVNARIYDSTMHHNDCDGLTADDSSFVDLHGTKTDIHSNKYRGIIAYNRAQVNIHLSSQHNTSHDNVAGDRHQAAGNGLSGGSIANINADGTFTHVFADDDDDDDEGEEDGSIANINADGTFTHVVADDDDDDDEGD